MVDCGESVPSTHRCGECGDDCFGTLDLEKLAEEFDGADWPSGSASTFVEWLKVRVSLSYALPVQHVAGLPDTVSLLIIDDSEEEDDGSLAS